MSTASFRLPSQEKFKLADEQFFIDHPVPQQQCCTKYCCLQFCKGFVTFMISRVGLMILMIGYVLAGGLIFEALEAENEDNALRFGENEVNRMLQRIYRQIENNSTRVRDDSFYMFLKYEIRNFSDFFTNATRNGTLTGNIDRQWDFFGSVFYCVTLVSTIGYGHITCKTKLGKIFTIVYSAIGIPLMMLFLANTGSSTATVFKFIYLKIDSIQRRLGKKNKKQQPLQSHQRSSGGSAATGASALNDNHHHHHHPHSHPPSHHHHLKDATECSKTGYVLNGGGGDNDNDNGSVHTLGSGTGASMKKPSSLKRLSKNGTSKQHKKKSSSSSSKSSSKSSQNRPVDSRTAPTATTAAATSATASTSACVSVSMGIRYVEIDSDLIARLASESSAVALIGNANGHQTKARSACDAPHTTTRLTHANESLLYEPSDRKQLDALRRMDNLIEQRSINNNNSSSNNNDDDHDESQVKNDNNDNNNINNNNNNDVVAINRRSCKFIMEGLDDIGIDDDDDDDDDDLESESIIINEYGTELRQQQHCDGIHEPKAKLKNTSGKKNDDHDDDDDRSVSLLENSAFLISDIFLQSSHLATTVRPKTLTSTTTTPLAAAAAPTTSMTIEKPQKVASAAQLHEMHDLLMPQSDSAATVANVDGSAKKKRGHLQRLARSLKIFNGRQTAREQREAALEAAHDAACTAAGKKKLKAASSFQVPPPPPPLTSSTHLQLPTVRQQQQQQLLSLPLAATSSLDTRSLNCAPTTSSGCNGSELSIGGADIGAIARNRSNRRSVYSYDYIVSTANNASFKGRHLPTAYTKKQLHAIYRSYEKERQKKIGVPMLTTLIIMPVYLFCGMLIFSSFENWRKLDALYFCFVTLTTIGFGDLIPGTTLRNMSSNKNNLYISALYIFVGLILIAMCINLMNHQLKNKIKSIAKKIGLTNC